MRAKAPFCDYVRDGLITTVDVRINRRPSGDAMRTGKRSTEIIGDTPFQLRHSPAWLIASAGEWHLLWTAD